MAKAKEEEAKEVEGPEPKSSRVGLLSKIMRLLRGKKAVKSDSK